MNTKWQQTFRKRIRDFAALHPSRDGHIPVSIKIRVTSGCFHSQHSPMAYKIIDKYLALIPPDQLDVMFKEHESGPEINSIYNKLIKTKYFNQLSQKQKEKYRKYGKWHNLAYKDLLNKAGFTEVFAKNIYNYLSSYSHSTSISLLQTSQANYDTLSLIQKAVITALFIASALYLQKYSKLFKEIENIYSAEDKVFIGSWCEFGKNLLKTDKTL